MLMANSPAPYANLDYYYGVQVSGTKTDNQTVEGEDLYDITVTNVGERSIINKSSISGNTPSGTYPAVSFDWSYYTSNIFSNWAIAPGMSVSFSTPMYGRSNVRDFSEYNWRCKAYDIECPSLIFENLALEKTDTHQYVLNGEISNLDDYYYNAIVEVTYKEVDYAFEVAVEKGSKRTVDTKEDLDLSQLIIKKATIYRSTYPVYKPSLPKATKNSNIPLIICIILLIAGIIAIPIVVVLARKRNKHKNIYK